MSKLLKEVTEEAMELMETAFWDVSSFEALQIAVQIQRNRILEDAFVVGRDCPSALEAIAMELGASKDHSSIKDALYNLNLQF